MRQGTTSNRMWHVAEIVGVLVLLICFGVRAASQHASAPQESSTEMQRIFSEDQADRQMNMAAMTPEQRLDWLNKFGPRDAQRRKQVMDLISRGALHTGQDFDEAAFVFQHGDRPDDYLLAHTLATVAIAKGNAKSRWIAAATLDRYLQKIQQPQIYGTQYFIGPNQGDKFTQEPYTRQLERIWNADFRPVTNFMRKNSPACITMSAPSTWAECVGITERFPFRRHIGSEA